LSSSHGFSLRFFLIVIDLPVSGATAEWFDKISHNAIAMEYISLDKIDMWEKQKYQYMLETNEIPDEPRTHPLLNGCATAQYTYGCCYEFPEIEFPRM